MSTKWLSSVGVVILLSSAAHATQSKVDPHCGEGDGEPVKASDFLKKATALNQVLTEWEAAAPAVKAVEDFRKKHGVPMMLWLSYKSLKKMGTKGLTNEGPGGNTLLSFQKEIPPVGRKGNLRSDIILELSEDGKVLRRWPFEADRQPDGVSGQELIFRRKLTSLCLADGAKPVEVPVAFAVRMGGQMRAVDPALAQGFEKMECPEGLSGALKAQSLVCRRYTDADGKPRILAVQPPIT